MQLVLESPPSKAYELTLIALVDAHIPFARRDTAVPVQFAFS
jgi:hypothetical protein